MHTPVVFPTAGIRMHSNEYHGTRIEYQRHNKPRAGGSGVARAIEVVGHSCTRINV